MSVTPEQEFALPADVLDTLRSATVIRSYLRRNKDAKAGGCRVFYSPLEWKGRGEEFGTDSVLIVVHDGGNHAAYFNPAYERPKQYEGMRRHLAKHGFWAEQQTGWYTAIYKNKETE